MGTRKPSRATVLTSCAVIVALGAMLHAESPTYSPYPYSRTKVRAVAQSCIGSLLAPSTDSVLFVADEDGEIVGMRLTIAGDDALVIDLG